jgi:hypothetical protein
MEHSYERLIPSRRLNYYVEHDEYKGYIIKFHPNVLIKTDEPDLVRARRAAEWFAYLDRRELKIVETLS